MNEDRHKLSAAECRSMILVSRHVRLCEYSQGFLDRGRRMTVGFSKAYRRSDLSFEISDSKAHIIIQ